jgi:hypothetical protein
MASPLSNEHTNDTFRPPPDTEDAPFLESGIPPGGTLARTLAARGETHAELALQACARADANLGSLLRTVQHMASAVNSARNARDEIVDELEHLRTLLGEADEEQLSLRHRTTLLEQTLERTERDAARERAFLIDEQDSFIGALWDDHAAEVAEVRRKLSTTEEILGTSQDENQRLADAAHSAALQTEDMARKLRKAEADLARVVNENASLRDTLARLQTEREEALLAASQTTRERDQIRAELGRLRSTSSTRPLAPGLDDAIPLVTRNDSRPPAPLRPTQEFEAPHPTPIPPPTSRTASLRRAEDHPEELRAALTHSDPPRSGSPSSRPSADRKSDFPARTLSGYSLSGEDVPEGTLDGRSNPRSPSR